MIASWLSQEEHRIQEWILIIWTDTWWMKFGSWQCWMKEMGRHLGLQWGHLDERQRLMLMQLPDVQGCHPSLSQNVLEGEIEMKIMQHKWEYTAKQLVSKIPECYAYSPRSRDQGNDKWLRSLWHHSHYKTSSSKERVYCTLINHR